MGFVFISAPQDHDSYRAFRSDNLNMSLNFETKPGEIPDNLPRCLFYGSTLRWMDKIKVCILFLTFNVMSWEVLQKKLETC